MNDIPRLKPPPPVYAVTQVMESPEGGGLNGRTLLVYTPLEQWADTFKVRYCVQGQVMCHPALPPIPFTAEIEAIGIREAFDAFDDTMRAGVKKTIRQTKRDLLERAMLDRSQNGAQLMTIARQIVEPK